MFVHLSAVCRMHEIVLFKLTLLISHSLASLILIHQITSLITFNVCELYLTLLKEEKLNPIHFIFWIQFLPNDLSTTIFYLTFENGIDRAPKR